MPVHIGARPDSGFDDPIGMLSDCHRRIEIFLRILATVAERAAGRSLTGEEAAAVRSALHYFKTGGVRHTADEEESLFPRMRAAQATDALARLEPLEKDHHEAADLHEKIDAIYFDWISTGGLDQHREQELRRAMDRLTALYSAHIEIEESIVFPQAARVLDREAIASIGQEFRARRA